MSLLDLEGNALIGQSREWNVSLSSAAVGGEGTGGPTQGTAVKETSPAFDCLKLAKSLLN